MELSDTSTPPMRDWRVEHVLAALRNEDRIPERDWLQRSEALADRRRVERRATQDEIDEAHRRLRVSREIEAAERQRRAEQSVCQLGIDETDRRAAGHRKGWWWDATATADALDAAVETALAGQGSYRCGHCLDCWAQSRAATPSSPTARPTNSAPSTGAASNTHITSTGGTSMGIEEIKQAIAGANERVATATAQLSGAQTELDEASAMLAQATNGSSDSEVVAALSTLRGIDEQLQQLSGQALQAGESALNYAGRL